MGLHGRSLPPHLQDLKKALVKSGHVLSPLNEANLPRPDRELVRQIRESTRQLNLNNVTRTMAYYDFYRRHPDIHWAFLGHMVSRNGGWNMTDLKGDLLSRIMSRQEQAAYFAFLERGNWLIFQDVYPQFLLYREGLKRRTSLFHLLPYFGVSVFMGAVWEQFRKSGDRYMLTMALIVNEQSYLEQRVIRNPHYQKTVLHTLEFQMQNVIGLNHVLFPYYKTAGVSPKRETGLIGQTVRQFDSLHDRIMLGKRLYLLLFGDSERWKRVSDWAADHVHTGSRKDYWSHLFNDVNESMPGKPYTLRLERCRLKSAAPRIYSPALRYAWGAVEHAAAEEGDWFRDWKVIRYLSEDGEPVDGAIQQAYCETLGKLELAVVAKTMLS